MSNLEEEDFRQSMRRIAATVCIISCERGGVRSGITLTSVTSLCFNPLSILACVNKASSVIEPLLDRGAYCINVLQKSQVDISKRFSSRLPASERFGIGDWGSGPSNIPYLCDAQANLFCEIDQSLAYATHQILIGRVIGVNFIKKVDPLIYQDGRYAGCEPLALSEAA